MRQLLAGAKFLDGFVQTALVSCGLVSLDQAFAGHAINFRDGQLVLLGGTVRIARANGSDDLFNSGAHARLQRDIVLATNFRLLGAFGC